MVKQRAVPRQPHDEAAVAVAAEGQVLIEGPDGLAIALTPAAALRSAKAITAAARDAERQISDAQ